MCSCSPCSAEGLLASTVGTKLQQFLCDAGSCQSSVHRARPARSNLHLRLKGPLQDLFLAAERSHQAGRVAAGFVSSRFFFSLFFLLSHTTVCSGHGNEVRGAVVKIPLPVVSPPPVVRVPQTLKSLLPRLVSLLILRLSLCCSSVSEVSEKLS